jgi:hypothetical protein
MFGRFNVISFFSEYRISPFFLTQFTKDVRAQFIAYVTPDGAFIFLFSAWLRNTIQ